MITFGTAGIRGPVKAITPELVASIGRAAAAEGTEFVVARDGRETGDALVEAVSAGLASGGADVVRLGTIPTPALAFASRGRHGIMITASHNPPADNGVKLFADGREFDLDTEARIEDRLADGTEPVAWDTWGRLGATSTLRAYEHALSAYLDTIQTSSDTSVSIVVDAGTGTAGLVAPTVLRRLGASVRTLNGSADGAFPARPSKPTTETIGTLRRFVANGPADIGFAFDGDADRLVLVDERGDVVHEDTVLAILAESYVRRAETPDPVVVTTPNASNRIDERVEAVGGRIVRTPLGQLQDGIARIYREAEEETDVVFAAEPWKHIHPSFGSWIDGILSAGVLTVLIEQTGLRELRDPIDELPYRKRSIECPDPVKARAMEDIETSLPDAFPEGKIDTAAGMRISFGSREWVLVRPSGTEPKIRIYVESSRADALADEVETYVRAAIDRHSID